MGFVAAVCPCCSAKLDLPEGRDRCFCTYCGSQILVEAAVSFAKVRVEGLVQTKQADFLIESGVLKEYHGESDSPVIPNEVKTIGKGAFARSEILSISIPSSVKKIDNRAFEWCKNLKTVNLPESLTSFGSDCFRGCESLREIKIPSGAEAIAWGMFERCSALERIEIPNTVKTIGGSAFKECSSLEEIFLPSSIEAIGDEAFRDCISLKRVDILSSAISLEDWSFRGCTSLREVRGPLSSELDEYLFDTPFILKKQEGWRAAGRCYRCGGVVKKGFFDNVCKSCGYVQ